MLGLVGVSPEEQRSMGWLRKREVAGYWQAYCSLCDRVAQDEHLESKPHMEAKQDPRKYMAFQEHVDGFFVHLVLEGEAPGLSLSPARERAKVLEVEPASAIERWNAWAQQFGFEVAGGSDVLEVGGLTGQDAVEALANASSKRRLGLTVASLSLDEEEDADDVAEAASASHSHEWSFQEPQMAPSADQAWPAYTSFPEQGAPWPTSPEAPSAGSVASAASGDVSRDAAGRTFPSVADIAGPGVLWQAYFDGVRGREGMGLETPQVGNAMGAGTVVIQAGACAPLATGLLRMPINIEADSRAVWVTLDARACSGQLFFSPGCAGCLWQAERVVVVRSEHSLQSSKVAELPTGTLVWQADACVPSTEILRMPIWARACGWGWVTLLAEAAGEPLLRFYLPGRSGSRWRARTQLKGRQGPALDSALVEPPVEADDVVLQQGDMVQLENGIIRLPVSRCDEQLVWVTLDARAARNASGRPGDQYLDFMSYSA